MLVLTLCLVIIITKVLFVAYSLTHYSFYWPGPMCIDFQLWSLAVMEAQLLKSDLFWLACNKNCLKLVHFLISMVLA